MPDDIADTFAHFCRQAGVSRQGVLEAWVRTTGAHFLAHGSTPPEQWDGVDEEIRLAWIETVELARQLDAERRGRRK